MTEKSTKKRNWAFLGYPESLPSDWVDQLKQTGLPIAVSPLHDSDFFSSGEPKKPHYHCILCYPGPTTFSVVSSLTDSINQPIPMPIDSVKGCYEYLTHKNDPDKAQYDPSGILHINGFNILDFMDYSRREIDEIKLRIHKLIQEYDIIEYADLMDFLMASSMFTEYSIASSNTLYFDRLISSRRHRDKGGNNE